MHEQYVNGFETVETHTPRFLSLRHIATRMITASVAKQQENQAIDSELEAMKATDLALDEQNTYYLLEQGRSAEILDSWVEALGSQLVVETEQFLANRSE